MNLRTIRHIAAGLLLSLWVGTVAQAADFFTISGVEHHHRPFKGRVGVWKDDINGTPGFTTQGSNFVPCIEVKVKTEEPIKGRDILAKAYFFDSSKKLVFRQGEPVVAIHEKGGDYAIQTIFPKQKTESLFFPIPEQLQTNPNWSMVAVFGDRHEAVGMVFPRGRVQDYDFPEKDRVLGKKDKKIERKAAMDPVVDLVVRTGNPRQPQITLFLRPPSGVTDGSQVQGVVAMCMLANDVEAIRRQLQGIEPGQEVGGFIGFAEKHKLAILAWGSHTLWNPNANYNDQTRQVNREMDESFDDVAKAWELGVKQLGQKYGIPQRNFMLWGVCGAAQWAHRLALRKPDYFLAVHVHIPGSFDQPTPEAAKMLWCLTTGELYAGYERTKRFYADCRKLGYPMVFKAIVGLGHAGSPLADELGLKFFEYALSVRAEREAYDESLKKSPPPPYREGETREPWLEAFRKPSFVGDLLNQEIFPLEQEEMMPAAFRVPLPTRKIADAWNLQP